MGTRRFGVVRPYASWMRERVFSFLTTLGYDFVEGLLVPTGTCDEEAAAWVGDVSLDLLLLPYHKHRSLLGHFVDGVGVAMLLSEEFVARPIPIVMPVSEFSANHSFSVRFDQLQKRRPEVAEHVVVVPESQVGSAEIADQIRRLSAGRPLA